MGEPYTDEEIEEMRNETSNYPHPDCTLMYLFMFMFGVIATLFIIGLFL